MKLACIYFTPGGKDLADSVVPRLEGWQTERFQGFGKQKVDLHRWTEAMFAAADALLFVGATGIAVRAIAPYIRSKTTDPAVLVMDETGRYIVPLLSGHIGGANRLARQLAVLSGGQAVLTTATDVRGLWAVDEWAAENDLHIRNPARIKSVSAKLLRGQTIAFYTDATLTGAPPEQVSISGESKHADVTLSAFVQANQSALQLVPACVAVGIGCRRGTGRHAIAEALQQALHRAGVLPEAVCGVYSIDRKKDEAGLLAFCGEHGWPFVTYSPAVLRAVAGSQSSSDFVRQTTGVDNVCERSALAGGGRLLLPKLAGGGVTIALAMREISYDFEELT